MFRFAYFLLIIFSLLIYYGCSSSSGSSRYGNYSDDSSGENSNRFSSDNDDENITATEDDIENLPEDDEVDISAVIEKYDPDYNTNIDELGTLKEKMLVDIIKYLHTPYQYGGNSKKGMDCSAFTQTIYKSTLSVDLMRSAHDQYSQGAEIDNMEDLQFGDLVFFDTGRGSNPGHVGIYIGDNLFAHASTTKGVTISSLNHSYYHSRFVGGRRIEPNGIF